VFLSILVSMVREGLFSGWFISLVEFRPPCKMSEIIFIDGVLAETQFKKRKNFRQH